MNFSNLNLKGLVKSLFLRKFTTGLLILQLAITLGLLVNSAILALDTRDNISQPTGLDNENILIVSTHPTSGNYRDLDYFRSIANEDLLKLNQLAGVKSVSITNQLPVKSRGMMSNMHDIDNPEQEKTDKYLRDIKYILAEEHLAQAMGFTLLEGRFLNKSDELDFDSEAKNNIVITESLKNALYGDKSALGHETNTLSCVVIPPFLTEVKSRREMPENGR